MKMGTITYFGDRTSGAFLIIASVSRTKITRLKRGFNRSAVLVFLVLSVTLPRPPLGQMLVRTFNHETCNV